MSVSARTTRYSSCILSRRRHARHPAGANQRWRLHRADVGYRRQRSQLLYPRRHRRQPIAVPHSGRARRPAASISRPTDSSASEPPRRPRNCTPPERYASKACPAAAAVSRPMPRAIYPVWSVADRRWCKQAAPGQPITVGAATDGTQVAVNGTAGNRTITGVLAGTVAVRQYRRDQRRPALYG